VRLLFLLIRSENLILAALNLITISCSILMLLIHHQNVFMPLHLMASHLTALNIAMVILVMVMIVVLAAETTGA
jgi:hypothetical protein